MAKAITEICVLNHLVLPPNGDEWGDKGRDHSSFQFNVSIEARMAGLPGGAGCPTPAAAAARNQAESNYYERNRNPDNVININKNNEEKDVV